MNAMGTYKGMKVESVACPKPRRAGACNDPVRPSRFSYSSHGGDVIDFAAGDELLDVILANKGGYGGERFGVPVESSPPYFNGSPPCRVSNPVIQDTHFGTEHIMPLSPAPSSPIWSSSPSIFYSGRKSGGGGGDRGGCVRMMRFGHKTPAIRVEGFECLGQDRHHCGISALA